MFEVQIIGPKIGTNNDKNIRKKKRVCAYCRVSTDLEEQRSSYKSQISHYTNYIKQNKNWKFVGIYADDGITGTQIKNREQFIKMIQDCKLGKIDMIIAKSISRFARNTVDTLNTVRMLRNLDIDVYFEKENIHTLNLDSEMFLTLYSAFAQAESESTSMNVKMGFVAKMKRGEPWGKVAIYGYKWNSQNKTFKINHQEAIIVKKIFNWYLEGLGSTLIVKKLKEENIKSPNGKDKWHPSVIKGILKNVKYVGDLCGQKYFTNDPITHRKRPNRGEKPMYYVSNHHPAIIDRETWNKVQEIYNKRSTKLKDGNLYCQKYSLRYPFSSKIICKHCGKTFIRRSTKYKNKDNIIHTNVYWVCSSYLYGIENQCNKRISVKEIELKNLFVLLIKRLIKDNKIIKEFDYLNFNEIFFKEVIEKIEIEMVKKDYYKVKYIINNSIFNYLKNNINNKTISITKTYNHRRFDTNPKKRYSYTYKKIKINASIVIDT